MKSLIFIFFLMIINPASADEKNIQTFRAEFSAPCGRSVLEISNDKQKNTIQIDPIGENPIKSLRYHVLIQTKFEITGYFTGKKNKSVFSDCVDYPEFYITSYKPLSIGRRIDVDNIDPDMHVYITNYPTNKFVPEDFENGPFPKHIDEYSYTKTRKNSQQVEIIDFQGNKWFCTLKNK